MRVLLVEDDKKLSLAITMRLKSVGYTVNTTPDAISAQSNALRFNPDVVVIDINLPGGDGFTVAERLINSPETQSTPFIFMTASKKEGLHDKAIGLGALGFLEKPFNSTQLTDLLDKGRY
jgi:DNA-binding response OmpR family regulator